MGAVIKEKINVKVLGDWYEAVVEVNTIHPMYEPRIPGTKEKILVIHKYNLQENLKKFSGNAFVEVECGNGYKSECYVGDARTLIEKDSHPFSNIWESKILIEKTFYDGEADTTFKQTYLFNKNHARVVFRETLPIISDFGFFTLGRKNTFTRTLWLTANGGFVLETEYSPGDARYNILEKSEAEDMVKARSKERYIEIFHPEEI